jgi:ATP-dependent Clp protease, protease subunit
MSVDEVLRVPYHLPGSQRWTWVNIFTRLSQERIIFLNQPLTMGLANSLIAALLYLDSDDQTKPIYLYINSVGDPVAAGMADEQIGMMSVMACLAIYDTMQHVKSEIFTICMGQAIGLSTLLLSSGSKGKRASLPHAMIALSQSRVGARGQATDLQINAKEVLEKRRLVMDIFARNTGQPIERLIKDVDRMFYLTPQEAQDYGLIDRVLQSPKELKQLTAVV